MLSIHFQFGFTTSCRMYWSTNKRTSIKRNHNYIQPNFAVTECTWTPNFFFSFQMILDIEVKVDKKNNGWKFQLTLTFHQYSRHPWLRDSSCTIPSILLECFWRSNRRSPILNPRMHPPYFSREVTLTGAPPRYILRNGGSFSAGLGGLTVSPTKLNIP